MFLVWDSASSPKGLVLVTPLLPDLTELCQAWDTNFVVPPRRVQILTPPLPEIEPTSIGSDPGNCTDVSRVRLVTASAGYAQYLLDHKASIN